MLNQTQLDDFMRLLSGEKQCTDCAKWVPRVKLYNGRCSQCDFDFYLDKVWNETPQTYNAWNEISQIPF